jgi:hypothetical protein
MTDVTSCYKNHDFIEEVHLPGVRLDVPLPATCDVCGQGPVTYAEKVAVYDPNVGFVGIKQTT